METYVDPVEEIKSIIKDSKIKDKEFFIRKLNSLKRKSFKNSKIKKIVWDNEGGYPECSWGCIEYTLRPYKQGFGCDGTTDNNIHLIASIMAEREGWNYAELYSQVNKISVEEIENWLKDIQDKSGVTRKETLMPVYNTAKKWALALNDLYQINARSLETALEDLVLEKYPDAQKYLSF